ncbi:fibronectin type-III domain-containing protein 3A-like isoform X6 [Narcine bancroftii]|uniref:fibronectin type-III domain-containing protein 3A-like isoform X6 n=1 Tax=Narcine bancroftii TaxID=1343680 RepID=UPI00383189F5
MNIPVTMAEHPPLEASVINEVPFLPHLVNGDTGQQVILVQVNAGETFTIRTEDGHIQCIPGPAHVPMMSPNGSMPPIYVPPGYVSQVIEENGIRRVVVLPHSAEFHPSNHPNVHTPPSHVPQYVHHHPALMPHPPVYAPLTGAGDIPPQFIPQHGPSHVFADQESCSSHGWSNFNHRDERTVKAHERLQKRLKDRQTGGPKDSPPSSPRKNHSTLSSNVQNGYGKGQTISGVTEITAEPVKAKSGKPTNSSSVNAENEDLDLESKSLQDLLSSINKPVVSEIKGKSVVLSWTPPSCADGNVNQFQVGCTYEVTMSSTGTNGKFKVVYNGEETTVTISELRPATDYHVRISAVCNSVKGSASEPTSFTSAITEPDWPAPPKLINRTKNSLTLQWKAPNDGGSKISNYLLEWDEGKHNFFKECYLGYQKQCKLTKLSPSVGYMFRLAAKNDIGLSDFSEPMRYYTAGSVPATPASPRLVEAGATWISLEWSKPNGVLDDEFITYVLEMEDESSGYGFKVKYNGDEFACTLKNLRRSTSYNYRASEILTVQSAAIPPGPCRPLQRSGKSRAKEVSLRWVPPDINGGSTVTEYTVEIGELGSHDQRSVYRGAELECTVGGLLPGKMYSFWVKAANKVGYGPYSERTDISTVAAPPDQCSIPIAACKTASCVHVNWECPPCNGSEITEFRLEFGGVEGCMEIIYCGPAQSYEVKALKPATAYYCRVQAVNAAGSGHYSDTAICMTPASVPAAVNVLQVINPNQLEIIPPSASTCLAIQWEEPCCHGSEITGYNIEYGDKQIVAVTTTTNAIVEDLQPDTTYRIRVQAINGIGMGPFSHSIKAKTKPLPPDPPRLECTVFSHQSLKLKWGEGINKALTTASTQYILQMEDKFGRFISVYSGPCHTYKVQRLNEFSFYNFKIQAKNDAGEGPFSKIYTFRTIRCPPPQLKAPKVQILEEHTCEIIWETLPPMKGDIIVYTLQLITGRDTEQVYKGPMTSFCLANVQTSCEYKFRVCAGRQYQDAIGIQELYGPYSPIVSFSSHKHESTSISSETTVALTKIPKETLSDEHFAALILVAFAGLSILFAFIIQYFVIK